MYENVDGGADYVYIWIYFRERVWERSNEGSRGERGKVRLGARVFVRSILLSWILQTAATVVHVRTYIYDIM